MRKFMIMSASTIALAIAGAGTAAAQQGAPTAPPQSILPGGPAAGAIKKNDTMRHDRTVRPRDMTAPPAGKSGAMERAPGAARIGVADSGIYKSYSADKSAADTTTITGGLTANKLIGADVHGPSGKEIAEVKDLAVNSNNRVDKAIVQVGGFFGIGSKDVAVDLAELKPRGPEKGFRTVMSEAELKTLPEYKQVGGKWVRSYKGG